jgi:hypothetical protein
MFTHITSKSSYLIYQKKLIVTMKLVIQTVGASPSPLKNEQAVTYLKQVHAKEASPLLELGDIQYHYLQIDDTADLDWLIPKLMELPGIDAAYQKPDDQPPGG